MTVIVHWNGVDVPEELKALEKGHYMLVPIDEPRELTEEEEAGIEQAVASIAAGKGIPFDEAERAALHAAIAQAWESFQAGEGRPAADVLRDLEKG